MNVKYIGVCRKWSWSISWYSPWHLPWGTKENHKRKKYIQDKWSPGWNSIWVPLKLKPDALLLS